MGTDGSGAELREAAEQCRDQYWSALDRRQVNIDKQDEQESRIVGMR